MPTALRGHGLLKRHMPTQSRGHGTRAGDDDGGRGHPLALWCGVAVPVIYYGIQVLACAVLPGLQLPANHGE